MELPDIKEQQLKHHLTVMSRSGIRDRSVAQEAMAVCAATFRTLEAVRKSLPFVWQAKAVREGVAEVIQQCIPDKQTCLIDNKTDSDIHLQTIWPLLSLALGAIITNARDAVAQQGLKVVVSAEICRQNAKRCCRITVANPGQFAAGVFDRLVNRGEPVRKTDGRYGVGLLTAYWAIRLLGGHMEFRNADEQAQADIVMPIGG